MEGIAMSMKRLEHARVIYEERRRVLSQNDRIAFPRLPAVDNIAGQIAGSRCWEPAYAGNVANIVERAPERLDSFLGLLPPSLNIRYLNYWLGHVGNLRRLLDPSVKVDRLAEPLIDINKKRESGRRDMVMDAVYEPLKKCGCAPAQKNEEQRGGTSATP